MEKCKINFPWFLCYLLCWFRKWPPFIPPTPPRQDFFGEQDFLNQHKNIHKVQLSVTLHFFHCKPAILLRELGWFTFHFVKKAWCRKFSCTAFHLTVCYNLLNFDWFTGANYFCAAKFIDEKLALWMIVFVV